MKLRVALVFGGRSSEHEISCATAAGVLAAIDRSRFEVVPIGITKEGAFTLQPDDPEFFRMNPVSMPAAPDNGTRVLWPGSVVSREVLVTRPDGRVESLGDIDVAFPLLHGPFGEDGTIQGMWELVGLPYVGSGVLASASAMDKHTTKTLLTAAGIAVAPWIALTREDWAADATQVTARARRLGLPIFVKPARAGSSVGVTKVHSWNDLKSALEIAWAEDRVALVEKAMLGREIECGVLSARTPGTTSRVSLAGEIVVHGREFYDFQAKYLDSGAAELICPARLSESELHEMQRLASHVFRTMGCDGLARVDFFYDGKSFVVNELNTMPGFTPISMFPKCWEASGLSYPALITELIELALLSRR